MKKNILFIAFLLFYPTYLLAHLDNQEQWQHLTTQDGLISNKIKIIYKAQNGQIWIVTDRGIQLYNGIFKQLYLTSYPIDNILELPTGQIFVSLEIWNSTWKAIATTPLIFDDDGSKWNQPQFFSQNNIRISTEPDFAVVYDNKLWLEADHGLVSFDGQNWQFHDYHNVFNTRVHSFSRLIKMTDGRIWTLASGKTSLGLSKTGLVSFDGQEWKLEFDLVDSIGQTTIIETVIRTSTSQILLGTNRGLFQYDSKSKTITDLQIGQIKVNQLYETADQKIWATTNQQIYQLVNGQWQLSLTDVDVNFIQQTNDGQIWTGTNQGLYYLDNGQWESMLSSAVNCLTELTDGTLLIGGNDGIRLRLVTENIFSITTEFAGQYCSGLFLASNGQLWARSTAGVLSYDGIEWTNHGGPDPKMRGEPLFSNIYEDSQGVMWFNSHQNSGSMGWRFDQGQLNSLKNYYHRGFLWGFTEIQDDQIIVSGRNGPRIYSDGQWESLSYPTAPAGVGYSGSLINHATFMDTDGSIWSVGRNDLWRYHDQKWVQHLDIESNPIPLGHHFSRGPDGILRLATDRGIYALNSQKKWVKELNLGPVQYIHTLHTGQLAAVVQALPSVSINGGLLIKQGANWIRHASFGPGFQYNNYFGNGFLEFPTGVYWLATNQGLRRIDGDSWYDITVDDGLPSNDVLAVELDSSNHLWIATAEGLVRFVLPANLNSPAIRITTIDSENYIPNDKIYVTGKPFVTLTWQAGDIETDADRLKYQYRLNSNWSEVTRQTKASIGLKNGEYHFAVRAIDHHFNTSQLDSLTIIVKTEAPDLSILTPISGDIVRDKLYIKGRVEDDDFLAFQLFISDTDLTTTPTLSDGLNQKLPYQLVFEAEAKPRTQTLAILQTTDFDDGDYQLWLTAQDQLQHSALFKVVFRIDNTLPEISIFSPTNNQHVSKNVNISARVSDLHLDSYRLDFSTDSAGKIWEQIYLQADLFSTSDDGSLSDPELKIITIDQDWQIPVNHGSVWIRLTATDTAGNTSSQTVEVQVPLAIETRQGGTISTDDQQVQLYLPPNTLDQDTIITINAMAPTELDLPLRLLGPVYDLAPISLQFNSIKPATLTLTYDPAQLSLNKQPIIFHRTNGAWQAVGGTPDPSQQTITTTVLTLGQYTVAETELLQPLDSARILPGSLTCQPRVFSPIGNSFNTTTTISFVLDQVANVDIKVYSVAGQLVNWLAEQRTFGSGQQALAWDGRDSQGEIVATGLYIISVSTGQEMAEKVVNLWNH